MNKSRRYIVCVLSVAFLTLGTAAALNYKVDPSNIFHSDDFAISFARAIRDGVNVEVDDFDDRLVHKLIIAELTEPPEVAVFGSSRHMEIRRDYFPDRSFFNHAMTHASLEDFLGLLEMYRRKNFHPAEIVMGLDPWNLDLKRENRRQSRDYLALARDLGINDYLQDPAEGRRASLLAMGRELISLVGVKRSLARWHLLMEDGHRAPRTQELYGYVTVWRSDGSKSYDQRHRTQTLAQVRSRARREAFVNFQGIPWIRSKAVFAFDGTVGYLEKKKIKVSFVLTPYHPIAYQAFLTDPKRSRIRDIETFFRRYARKHAIPIYGSYDPARAGCPEAEFYDAQHPKESCMRRILGAPARTTDSPGV